jgi:hypothetical protein
VIEYAPRGVRGFVVTVAMGGAPPFMLEGAVDEVGSLTVVGTTGYDGFASNAALVTNLAAYGRHELLARRARAKERKASHSKQGDRHRLETLAIAAMEMDVKAGAEWVGWCSGCFARSSHRKVRARGKRTPGYLCSACGSPTVRCAVPTCPDMAVRGQRGVDRPRWCAAHRHDIPSFTKMSEQLACLEDYEEWLRFERVNAGRVTKIVSVAALAAACIGPQAFAAAPAIGGAIGANAGALGLSAANLSGAAATNFGLAWLGGGAVAAGGAGMAGGALVVGATGAALGGTLGAAATSAYVSADKSFRIEKLRDGSGPAVLVASGFLTEAADAWGPWQRLIDARYPESPVYRVHWGAKELKAFAVLAGVGGGKLAAKQVVGRFAARASKKAAGLGPLAGVLMAIDVATNPWSVARSRAAMTGAVLADLIARCDDAPFVLIGHSLGGRVMVTAAQALATKRGEPRIAEMHLLAAAVATSGDWRSLHESVAGTTWNYYSKRDAVLSRVFRTVELGRRAIGEVGINSKFASIKDCDESKRVSGHSAYFSNVTLRA